MSILKRKRSSGHTYGNVIAHGGLHQGDCYSFNTIGRRSRFLDSLSFPEMNSRINAISEAHGRTFEWLFEPPELAHIDTSTALYSYWDYDASRKSRARSDFHNWLRHGNGVFLIEGKAGSGKSVLMKSIYHNPLAKAILSTGHDTNDPIILCHCFWLAGSESQRDFRGMLLTLVSQAFEALPEDVAEAICKLRDFPTKRSVNDWSETSLRAALQLVFKHLDCRVLILLDGLDEYDSSNRPCFFRFVQDLLSNFEHLRICVSSRPAPWLERRWSDRPHLRLQDLTVDDIRTYTNDVLKEEFAFDEAKLSAEEMQAIENLVTHKAEGVFLWVKYALHSLSQGAQAMDDIHRLQSRLQRLPGGMEDLYRHMWARYDNDNTEYTQEAAQIFACLQLHQSLRCSPNLLHMTALLDTELQQHYSVSVEPFPWEKLERKCAQTKNRIMIRTAGILTWPSKGHHSGVFASALPRQSIPQDDFQRISRFVDVELNYIHLTAREFLSETEFGQSLFTLSDDQKHAFRRAYLYSDIPAAVSQCSGRFMNLDEMFRICSAIGAFEETYHDQMKQSDLHKLESHLEQLMGTRRVDDTSLVIHQQEMSFHDFAGMLALAGVNQSVKNLVCDSSPRTAYLNYLLSRTIASMWRFEIDRCDDLVRWLLSEGASITTKCEYPVRIRHKFHTMFLSSLDLFFAVLVNKRLNNYANQDWTVTPFQPPYEDLTPIDGKVNVFINCGFHSSLRPFGAPRDGSRLCLVVNPGFLLLDVPKAIAMHCVESLATEVKRTLLGYQGPRPNLSFIGLYLRPVLLNFTIRSSDGGQTVLLVPKHQHQHDRPLLQYFVDIVIKSECAYHNKTLPSCQDPQFAEDFETIDFLTYLGQEGILSPANHVYRPPKTGS